MTHSLYLLLKRRAFLLLITALLTGLLLSLSGCALSPSKGEGKVDVEKGELLKEEEEERVRAQEREDAGLSFETEDGAQTASQEALEHRERPEHPERLEREVGEEVQAPQTPESWVDLMDRLRAGFAFPERSHPRIEDQIRYYQTHPDVLSRNLQRAERYLYYVITELEKRQMPLELALLPYVESNYNPFAFSSGCAAGLWQFIPSTGDYYGLKQTWWYDGRRDIVASTDAALAYLDRLFNRFSGDWHLALAAYNGGQGFVARTIARNQRANRPTDYWNLPLSAETNNYVPKLLALTEIIKNPEAYGFRLPVLNNQPAFDQVDVEAQIDFDLVSELTGLSEEEIIALNPAFNRWATDPEGPHQLLIPIEQVENFRQALSAYPPEARVRWERYRVESGDSLIAIAKRFETTVEILRYQNGIKGHLIRVGELLMVPRTSHPRHNDALLSKLQQGKSGGGAPSALSSERSRPLQQVSYTIRQGDALYTIARRFSVTLEQLIRWNNITDPARIRPGDRLTIHVDPSRLAESS